MMLRRFFATLALAATAAALGPTPALAQGGTGTIRGRVMRAVESSGTSSAPKNCTSLVSVLVLAAPPCRAQRNTSL